ncbi:MAG: Spy/CpxP family protein refolding chaperone [Terriglobales bacterium]
MKRTVIMVVAIVLLGLATASAQAPAPRPPMAGPGGDWMGHIPQMLGGDWWNNPEIANELRLTDQQKRQLEQSNTNLKLALIDAAASGLKSFVHLQALLDADQLDTAAYSQQSSDMSAAASKLVKDVADAVLMVRKTLTADQWHKLTAMRASGHMAMHARPDGTMRHDQMHPPAQKPPQ